MTRSLIISAFAFTLNTSAVLAVEPELPGQAALVTNETTPAGTYQLPTGRWADGVLPAETLNGSVSRRVWRLAVTDLTSLQMLESLTTQLAGQGFELVFECDTQACGGFDFRFATEVVPEPEMHVNLGDFRFFSARLPDKSEAVSVIVSRSRETGFIQMIHVGPAGSPPLQLATSPAVVAAPPLEPSESTGGFAEILETRGHALLGDLEFRIGGASLGEGEYASLTALADYLLANPSRRVTLVGHTDSVGSLDNNIALSKQRAQSVRARLIGTLNVPPAQVSAEGMGYLAPVASNLSAEGREANRRVEVILTSVE